jgi:hypothetical protein
MSVSHSYKRQSGRICFFLLASCALALLGTQTAEGADYYLSATGNDQYTGTAPDSAWRSLERLNSAQLEPGDRVFFEGGSTFWGGVMFEPEDTGSDVAPIVMTSYGRAARPSTRATARPSPGVTSVVMSFTT